MSILKPTAITGLFNAGAIAAGAATNILLARLLGPSGYGSYSVWVQTVTLLALIGALGQYGATTYYIARGEMSVGVALGNVLAGAALFGGLVMFVCVVWRGPLLSGPLEGQDGLAVILAGAAVPVLLLSSTLPALFLGKKRIWAYATTLRLSNLLRAGLVVVLSIVGSATVHWAVGITTLAYFASALVALGLAAGMFRERPRLSRSALLQSWKYGLPLYFGNLLGYLTVRVMYFFLNHHRGSDELGRYTLAANFAELLLFVPSMMGMITFADLAARSPTQAAARTIEITRRVAMLGAMALAVLPLPMFLLLPKVSGEEYRQSLPILAILLPGCWAWGISLILLSYLPAVGHPGTATVCLTGGFVTTVVVGWICVPLLGGVGAALATTGAQVVTMVISAGLLVKESGCQVRDLVGITKEDRKAYRAVLQFVLHLRRPRPGAL